MSSAAAPDISEEEFLGSVAELTAADPTLSAIGASVLLALHLGICADTRTFSRIFGIEHALVLREMTALSEAHLVALLDRNPRTQRTILALTDASQALLARNDTAI
jgi:hypothetical protein